MKEKANWSVSEIHLAKSLAMDSCIESIEYPMPIGSIQYWIFGVPQCCKMAYQVPDWKHSIAECTEIDSEIFGHKCLIDKAMLTKSLKWWEVHFNLGIGACFRRSFSWKS